MTDPHQVGGGVVAKQPPTFRYLPLGWQRKLNRLAAEVGHADLLPLIHVGGALQTVLATILLAATQ
ncbi:MAG: hypothetical protein ACRC4P_09090 [Aeromonas sp.]